jgi:hypothetical protein
MRRDDENDFDGGDDDEGVDWGDENWGDEDGNEADDPDDQTPEDEQTPKPTGNTIEVAVMPGGDVKTITVGPEEQIAAAEAFRRAGLSTTGCEIQVNQQSVGPEHPVSAGDVVMAFRRVKGA